MKIRDHYDWIVIGEDPPGLLAAAMAARLGLSVLVLNAGKGPEPRITNEGLVLDPESNFFPALSPLAGRSQFLRHLLQSVADGLPLEREIRPEIGVTRVVTSGARLAYGGTRDFLEKELVREFPSGFLEQTRWIDVVDVVERHAQRFWRGYPLQLEVARAGVNAGRDLRGDAPARRRAGSASLAEFSDWSRSVTSRLLRDQREIFRAFPPFPRSDFPEGERAAVASGQWVSEEEFLEVLGAILASTHGPCEVETLESASVLQGIGLARSGAGFRGGAQGLRRWLRFAGEKLGVHLPARRECRRIFVDQGRLIGVQMENSGSVITCDGILVAGSIDDVRQLFTEGTSAVPVKFLRDIRPVSWQMTVALGFRRQGVPPTLPSRGWISEPSAPGIEFEQIRTVDYSGQDLSDVTVNLRTRIPLSFGNKAFEPSEWHRIALRMFRKFTEVFPGIEKHLHAAYPDFREANAPERFRAMYPFRSEREIPYALRCYSCHDRGGGSQSGFDTILMANRESYPELGALGPYVAAVESVAWLAHRAGLSGPMPEQDLRAVVAARAE